MLDWLQTSAPSRNHTHDMATPDRTDTPELFNVNLSEDRLRRFRAKIDKRGPVPKDCPELGRCWVWTAATLRGYGQFGARNAEGRFRTYSAHRLSFLLEYGPFPKEFFVCHRCDTRRCQNPAHLVLGTCADNLLDMSLKGRGATGDKNGSKTHPERVARGDRNGSRTRPERVARGDRHSSRTHPEKVSRGERHGQSKLKPGDIFRIREAMENGASLQAVADTFGCSKTHICGIKNRRYWKHLP